MTASISLAGQDDVRDARRIAAVLGLVTLIAAVLRLNGLDADSLWFDEAASWNQSRGDLGHLLALTANDNYPPLHNLILWVFIQLFGDSEFVLRLPSALMGIAAVPAIYWVGAQVGGWRVGLLAGLMLALSGFHIWFSQETRMYTLLMLAGILLAGTSVRFLRTPSRRSAVFIGAAGIALVYSHPYGTLTWLAIAFGSGAVMLRRRFDGRNLRIFALTHVAVAVAFVPWALLLLERVRIVLTDGFWLPFPTPTYVYSELGTLLSGQFGFFALAIAVGVVLGGGHRPSGARTAPQLDGKETTILLGAWVLVPILCGFVCSMLFVPVFSAKYVSASLPALIIAASIGLTRVATDARAFGAILVVAGAVLGLGQLNFRPYIREDWRGVAAFLDANRRSDDCIVLSPEWTAPALRYYDRNPIACIIRADKAADIDLDRLSGKRVIFILAFAAPQTAELLDATGRANPAGNRTAFRNINIYVQDAPGT